MQHLATPMWEWIRQLGSTTQNSTNFARLINNFTHDINTSVPSDKQRDRCIFFRPGEILTVSTELGQLNDSELNQLRQAIP